MIVIQVDILKSRKFQKKLEINFTGLTGNKMPVLNCDVQVPSRKEPAPKTISKLQIYIVESPFEKLVINILEPLPLTKNENNYLLVAIDYFTKWPEVISFPNQKASTVVKTLVDQVYQNSDQPQSYIKLKIKFQI